MQQRPQTLLVKSWRAVQWQTSVVFFLVCISLGLDILTWRRVAFAVAALSVAGGVCSLGRYWQSQRQLRQSLLALDYQMCAYCGYSLIGLTTAERCPECGAPYSHDRRHELWQ